MAKAFVKKLPDGSCKGNTRGLLRCRQEGWQILGDQDQDVRHAPRVPSDSRPWTDGVNRFRALDCRAVPLHRRVVNPSIGYNGTAAG